MKIFKRKGKSFTGLFIQTFFVSIIAVIASVIVFGGMLYNNFFEFMTDKFYTDKDIVIHGANVLPDNYKDLDKDYVIKNNGWIEVLQDNEVVDVIGDKKDDTVIYNSNLLAFMNENGEMNIGNIIEPIGNEYSVKVYDEELKYTYLVKIPRFDAQLNNYVDKMLALDVEDNEIKEFEKITIKVILVPIGLGIITFIGIMGIHIFLAIKSIKKPLAKIQSGIDEFSNGNMEAKIDFYSYYELNKIKDNFNYMIDKIDKTKPLAKIQSGIDEFSNGNMEAKIDFYSYYELNKIKDNFNYMIDKIDKTEKERLKSEESKKNMIRDISHDIKTPITSILGYSKAIVDKENMSEEERDTYLGYIHDKTIRIDYLINELFKFVELDSPNYKLNKVERDYVEFIRDVVLLHYKDIEDKHFILDMDLEDKEILLNFDDKNMERAISNLIVNAIKYNEENTKLKISVKECENEVITVVEDDGVGIDEGVCERLFDEFVRGDESRNSKGGSGLGLAITKKIVELHNGSISLESKLGEGSKFIIKLNQ